MNNRKGFTLTEIIVVLVVIAVLAAITIPSSIGYINKAKQSKAVAECQEVVHASQIVAVDLYSKNELLNENDLLNDENKNQILSLSETAGSIISIDYDINTSKILNLSYLSSNDLLVHYDADTESLYSIDNKIPDSAPDYTVVAERILIDEEILSTYNQRNKQTQALQVAFLEENEEVYPVLSASEQQMMKELRYTTPENLNWRPIISATGEIFLAGSTADVSKPNPLSCVIYYNGNYYWYHYNTVKTSYVSDSSFNINLLDSTKTTLGATDLNGAWLVYVDTQ